jgi:hypothetical protein
MKLANTLTKLLAALAVSAVLLPALLPGLAAQEPASPPPPQAAAQKPAHKAGHKAKAAKQSGTAPAPAPAAAPAAPAADQSAAPAGEAAPGGEKSEAAANKRDPFVALIYEKKDGGGGPHIPGKAGLVIASVRVDGTVQSPGGMIAVVSNSDQHVYFVREGDRLYDGDVEKIGLDGVTFKEDSKDAFGKPVSRMVTKRIYPSAGEQQ